MPVSHHHSPSTHPTCTVRWPLLFLFWPFPSLLLWLFFPIELLRPSWPDAGYLGPQKEFGCVAFNTHQSSPLPVHPSNLHGATTITSFVLTISIPVTLPIFFSIKLLRPFQTNAGYLGPQKELGCAAFNTHQSTPLSVHPSNSHGATTITFLFWTFPSLLLWLIFPIKLLRPFQTDAGYLWE